MLGHRVANRVQFFRIVRGVYGRSPGKRRVVFPDCGLRRPEKIKIVVVFCCIIKVIRRPDTTSRRADRPTLARPLARFRPSCLYTADDKCSRPATADCTTCFRPSFHSLAFSATRQLRCCHIVKEISHVLHRRLSEPHVHLGHYVSGISDSQIANCRHRACLTTLSRAIAKALLSVCPSVRLITRDPRLNGSNFRNTFHTLPSYAISDDFCNLVSDSTRPMTKALSEVS